MDVDPSLIDHQVTYWADAALHNEILKRLDRHRVVKRTLRTTYLDTVEHHLFHGGITLRDRATVGKKAKLGHVKTEAKVPTAAGLQRTSGVQAHAAVAAVLGANVVSAEQLRPSAIQTKTRQLLLVSGRAFAPEFVVALDTVDVEVGSERVQRLEVEAQIFTALPWTKNVDTQRVARFDDFCRKLELDFGLRRAEDSGYQAILVPTLGPPRMGVGVLLSTQTKDGPGSAKAALADAQFLDGLTEGAKLKTEALFSGSSQLVVDASHVATVQHEGLSVVPVAEVFSNPATTFLGFGKPNVFLSVPRVATADVGAGWDKFAAFMFWRKGAHIADTKGRVQGGVFVELRNLPPEAVERLRDEMQLFVGRKTITCANATGRVMSKAGFTCTGRTLAYKVRPMTLAKAIWNGGLEYDGNPVALRVIRTSSGTVSDHFLGVLRKESTSLFRAVEKVVRAKSVKAKAKGPMIEPRLLNAATLTSYGDASLLELRVGRPTPLAVVLRQQWGEHPIFEARLNPDLVDINGPDFTDLGSALKAYPGKLDGASKLKRYLLFSKPVIRVIRKQMAAKMDSLGQLPGPILVDMFQTGTVDKPFLYNVVITGTSARMTRLENRNEKDVGKANWVLAKHVLLSGYDPDVRYAGEIWVHDTANGRILHLNDNSGTYKPSRQQAQAAKRFLQKLTGVTVELHVGPPSPGGAPPADDGGFTDFPEEGVS